MRRTLGIPLGLYCSGESSYEPTPGFICLGLEKLAVRKGESTDGDHGGWRQEVNVHGLQPLVSIDFPSKDRRLLIAEIRTQVRDSFRSEKSEKAKLFGSVRRTKITVSFSKISIDFYCAERRVLTVGICRFYTVIEFGDRSRLATE